MFTDRQENEPFQWLLVLNRIKHEQSAFYSPHQNRTAEWSWQTLFSMARYLLIESKLPKNLWLQHILEITVRMKTQEKPHMKILMVQNHT